MSSVRSGGQRRPFGRWHESEREIQGRNKQCRDMIKSIPGRGNSEHKGLEVKKPAVLEEAGVTAWLGRERPATGQRLVHWEISRPP